MSRRQRLRRHPLRDALVLGGALGAVVGLIGGVAFAAAVGYGDVRVLEIVVPAGLVGWGGPMAWVLHRDLARHAASRDAAG